jgi:predicted glycoside hydrolase/deacetylase ChbG (UPF0249 family)
MRELVEEAQEKKQSVLVEYMCHPGYPSVTGDAFSQSSARLQELQILTDGDVAEALGQWDSFRLVTSEEIVAVA